MKNDNVKFKIIFLSVIFLGIFALAKNSEAATYYVKNGGNDSLAGTSDETAWETIAKVQSIVQSGDTVYFRSQDVWTNATPPVLTAKAGVIYDGSTYGSGTRATLQATGGSDSGQGVANIFVSNVTLKGLDLDANEMPIIGVNIGYSASMPADISNITIDDCLVHNGRTVDVGNQYYYGILVGQRSAHTTRNVAITNTKIYDCGHEGISIYPTWTIADNKVDTVLVQNCEIYNTGLVTSNRGAALDIANESDNVTAENNYIHDCASGFRAASYNPDTVGSPNGVVFRYNMLKNAGGIGLNSYFGNLGIDGDGEIYSNLVINGGLSIPGTDFHSKSWKFYNNTFYSDYTAGLSSYALDVGYSTGVMNASGIEIKNNIFYLKGLRTVRDQTNSLSNIDHDNNLFYRSDSSSAVVQTSVLADANVIPSTSVSVTHDATYTYFTKSGGTDWTTVFSTNNAVKWSGFANAEFNNRLFQIRAVTADVITVMNIIGQASGPTETIAVTGEKWALYDYPLSGVTTWESTAQAANPLFVDIASNNFKLTSGSPAINNGTSVGLTEDYSGNSIVGNPDIGAFELDTVSPASPVGLTVN